GHGSIRYAMNTRLCQRLRVASRHREDDWLDGDGGRMATLYAGRASARRWAGLAAGACFAAALAGVGAALDGYAHAHWPVALLSAAGVPRAGAFNLAAFVVPGVLAAFVALCRRGALAPGASRLLGLGWTLALLAALAFAAQGLLPL